MKIKIICIGKTKEAYLLEGMNKFLERISFYTNSINIIELPPDNNRDFTEKIKKIAKGYKILLDVVGKELSSEQFSDLIQQRLNRGCSEIDFFIGGYSGIPTLSEELIDFRFSLSRCTFTHQMIRLLLLEQIYRAFTILKGHPYHK